MTFEAHRLLYHSTLVLRVIKKKASPPNGERRSMNIEEVIGRQGHAMVLLRVLQLMCAGDKAEVRQCYIRYYRQCYIRYSSLYTYM